MAVDASIDTRQGLWNRAEELRETEPNFARFMLAAVNATDPDDLLGGSLTGIEATLRSTYTRLGKRDGKSHLVFAFAPEHSRGRERIEVFSADMPFIVDSVLAAIRARGGTVRFMSHPVLHLDPESHRLLDEAAPVSVSESLLLIEIDRLPGDEAREAMVAEIDGTLDEVLRATRAWRPMLERLRRVVEDWRLHPPRSTTAAATEAKEFLAWLAEHNFTFLGMREYRLEGGGEEGTAARLLPLPTTGIGILDDKDFHFLRAGRDYAEMTEQHVAWLAEPDPILVTKANVRTRVHRRAYMDYVGVKLYREGGEVSGELRIVGLFTSAALATPHSEVPLIRRKVAEVMRRSGYDPGGHAGKALMAALDSYPRDELFQIGQDRLFEFSKEIAALADRPRVRVLPRVDRFDNFVSLLVYLPRDRYSSAVRERIGEYLARAYEGRVSAYYPHFPEGELVRVHFIIGRDGGPTPQPNRAVLEERVAELLLTFSDRLLRLAGERAGIARWATAFSPAYQSRNSAEQALADIEVIEQLAGDASLALRLVERSGGDGAYGLKVYHRDRPIPLSDRVPMLENFGFRVIDEHTYTAEPSGLGEIYIHDMVLDAAGAAPTLFAERAPLVEEAILAVWQAEAESDALNQLVLGAGLAWPDVAILRALLRYLKQVGVTWSRAYLAQAMNRHPDVARALVTLFQVQLQPGFPGNSERSSSEARETIAAALEATQSLDEDRIIRRVLNLVEAALRTNAFQSDAAGRRRPALAIKFDSSRVEGMPEPKPYREIFVYSPRVEGLHLRFGPIARGGLRWSDRAEDFRTEVLGLVKAQQVKNSIIVPVGAKGAFVPRMMPRGADREAVQAEGVACYKIFIQTLLDLTDDLDGELVIPPPDVRRRDADDPYLVVAADKGTASFSDTANAIATERGFWLGDAFASGGSNGYDHKRMGITARGAWEAVKRHFREIDRDIQARPFTVAGVGDMSGDVFGNGMLLSEQIRLVATFDHRDIFIDPDPDPAASFRERQRLFNLPRSSWQDYDKSLLSKGGGVYSRALKSVPLFGEARRALGLGDDPVTPQEVMVAILKADVDLLWFGGIGTYVRSSLETDADAGDKGNDAIRITGEDVRATVIGEGANLAVTQRGRVEFALLGGKIDTDAIDNSAGVNASDIEVNVKIAMNTVMRTSDMSPEERNGFIASLTDEVAQLCLRNNYLQPLAISIAEHAGAAALPDHRALIEALEARGQLNRAVEFLPDETVLAERAANGRGLTRPEIAVLLAYAKNSLYADLLGGKAPDDPYLGHDLFRYFPPTLAERYPDAVTSHRLRREVIATVLSNQMINRGGPAFLVKVMAATSADAAQVAAAFCLARDAYGLERLYAEIDALDGQIAGRTQLELYTDVGRLLERETLWLLRNADFSQPLSELVLHYAEGVTDVAGLVASAVPPGLEPTIAARAESFTAGGAPKAVARRIAELQALSYATDIVLVADRTTSPVAVAAGAFFGVLDVFGLAAVFEAGGRIVLTDRFDRMALDRALANLLRAQRDLAVDVLGFGRGEIESRLAAWRASRPQSIERVAEAVRGLTAGNMTVSRLSVAAGLLSDLARSA
ncbi:MAG TPA: NAD-glutamate dehydrogenase [Devosia sp.]|nr:NAD-glutamate dehydrogenase [Devosia sp.]